MGELLFLAITISLITTSYCQNISSTSSSQQSNVILDEPSTDTDTTIDENILNGSDVEDINGGGVWSSIGMIAVVICGCICVERLYSSCKKVYQKRTGTYGFSRLQNQTFNEFEDDEVEMGLRTRNTKDSDQESV